MIKERSEISKLFTEMQNHISKEFKLYVSYVWENCGHRMQVFQRVMRSAAKYHLDPSNYSGSNEDMYLSCVNDMTYREYMEAQVFDYSDYNDIDIDERVDEWEDFSFSSMFEAFNKYIDAAITQFSSGKNIDEKIFKQLVIIQIVNEYKVNNIKLTLRQLYYQLVSKEYIENTEREYKKLIDLTGNMREFCVLELDEFADNTRFSVRYKYDHDPREFIFKNTRANKYFRDSRENQGTYIEMWIEKEALRTVFQPVTDRWDIPLFICRGYPSTSSLYEQASKIYENTIEGRTAEEIENVIILYFGDHDPSGLQIPEAIERIFHEDYQMQHVTVKHCGLWMDHVRKFKLPPNPAKMTDPRAAKYTARHGDISWELDAMPTLELQKIAELNITEYTDMDLWQDSRNLQAEERKKLEKVHSFITKNWDKMMEG